jgi:hypothetical protein
MQEQPPQKRGSKSRKLAPKVDDKKHNDSDKVQQTPPIPIPMLQQVGEMFDIVPEELTVDKLMGQD